MKALREVFLAHLQLCFISFLVCGNFAVKCELHLSREADLIQSFSQRFHSKFVLITKSSQESDQHKKKLVDLQKILNHSFQLHTSILHLKQVMTYLLLNEYNLRKTMVFARADSATIQDLGSFSQDHDVAPFMWLIHIESPDVMYSFKPVYIPFDSKFFFVFWRVKNEHADLYEIYQVSRNSDQIVNHFGEWKKETGLEMKHEDLVNARRDLRGVTLRYFLYRSPDTNGPCSIEYNEKDPLIIFECINYAMWNEFQAQFNFTTEYVVMKSGDQNAILNELRQSRGDSGSPSYVLSSLRKAQNRFLSPIFHSKIYLLTRVPYVEINFASFFEPFTASFWLALLAWLVIVGLILVLLNYVVEVIMYHKKPAVWREYLQIYLIPYEAMCSQSCALEATQISIRIALFMTYIIPVFFITAYSGELTSSLATPEEIPFRNLRQFEENSHYQLIGLKNSFFEDMLKEDDEFENLRKKSLVSDVMPTDYNEAFAQICSKKLTFLTDLPAVTTSSPTCNIFLMDETVGTFFASMAVGNDFRYAELINRNLHMRALSGIRVKSIEKKIIEILKRELRSSKGSRNPFESSGVHELEPFTLENVLLLFTLLCGGMVCSVILLCVEVLHVREKNNTFNV